MKKILILGTAVVLAILGGYEIADACCGPDPPAIYEVSCTPEMLWPPNHQYKQIEVRASVNSDQGTVWEVWSVASNQPDNFTGAGDGETTNDCYISDSGSIYDAGTEYEEYKGIVQARAERCGNQAAAGSGRVYTIEVRASNAAGEVFATCLVQVPHSRGQGNN